MEARRGSYIESLATLASIWRSVGYTDIPFTYLIRTRGPTLGPRQRGGRLRRLRHGGSQPWTPRREFQAPSTINVIVLANNISHLCASTLINVVQSPWRIGMLGSLSFQLQPLRGSLPARHHSFCGRAGYPRPEYREEGAGT